LVLEFAPTDQFTFTSGIWMWPSFWYTAPNGETERSHRPRLNPSIGLEPRFYFNLNYRDRIGKRTDYYSGWFVALPFTMEFPEQRFNMGSTIGFQRTFGRRWYWNFHCGPGFTLENGFFRMTGSGDVAFGVILSQ
jgi:hypothetical protein